VAGSAQAALLVMAAAALPGIAIAARLPDAQPAQGLQDPVSAQAPLP
jgi:hypothetical protein